MRKRRSSGTRMRGSSSSNPCMWIPSSSPRGLTRPEATCSSCPRSASRRAHRVKWRDFASPIPRMRSSLATGFAREDDHLLVVRMTPVACVRERQARAVAGETQGLYVVVVLVAVVVGHDTLRLLDVAQIGLALRVLVDRRVELAARPEHLRHLDEAAHDRVERQVREDRLRDRVVERLTELPEREVAVDEEERLLRLEPEAGQLHLPGALEVVPSLVDPRVVPRLEVADEVHARPQRPAADVEEVVARLEALLDEVVELEAPELLPERGVPAHRAAVPVGIPQTAPAGRQGTTQAALDRDGDEPFQAADGRPPFSCHGYFRPRWLPASTG